MLEMRDRLTEIREDIQDWIGIYPTDHIWNAITRLPDRPRRWFANRCRFFADRLHEETAFRGMGSTFTFELNEGIRWRDDGRGCPVWYWGEADYARAYVESDTKPRRINWSTMSYHPEET